MSQYTRVMLQPSSDTGTALDGSDTGPSVWGELMQVHWQPNAAQADTGANLQLFQKTDADTGPGDTGAWSMVFNSDSLGAARYYHPRRLSHHPEGVDTGRADLVPVVFAGERVKAKLVAGQDDCAGEVLLWFKK